MTGMLLGVMSAHVRDTGNVNSADRWICQQEFRRYNIHGKRSFCKSILKPLLRV
jgi:hypothetical protein